MAKCIATVVIILLICLVYFKGDEPQKPKSKELQQQELTAGERPYDFDGSITIAEVKIYLRNNLKDPDSLDLIESWPVFFNDGQWHQRVRYRAKNSFGGFRVEEKIFSVEHGRVVNVTDLSK